ncbi:MAG: 4'-phosphopantetheinyl transferase superfamily protein [Roseovarius sp.]|uniref:4'-phosphopantetheinyl transferase family protein n=2 Tax=Roseovarius sp. TaxID=1486281 RepID=UPI001B533CE7|nr:4'-phosphopantetheinyl transferase superfamily protein [Roseovarius sp.]MBQ0749652.1 4'-phosphopantetheinyl transferase superfamily protein [Roseovarius sp.]
MSAALIAALRALLPERLALAASDPRAEATGLWPEEATAMARAVPNRRREFAAGRRAARSALATLGHAPAAIPMAPDRAPLWPEGVTGTISHGAGICLALLGRSEDWAGLGLDLEPALPLPEDTVATICTPAERETVTQDPSGLLSRRLFCAKEATYKAQYAQSRRLLSFHDLEVTFDASGGFSAELLTDCPPFPPATCFAGHSLQTGDILAALVTLPRL